MKTVISASRRTDIPAYYLGWFMDRIREGQVVVQNPLYKKYSMTVNLTPDSVEWIIFWSRDYSKFLKHRSFFKDYLLFFHFTVLSHHSMLEKKQISPAKSMKQMEELVAHFGCDRIIWRYDPVICWEEGGIYQSNYKRSDFLQLCKTFSALGIHQCYFSYVTDYRKFRHRFQSKFPGLNLLWDEKYFRPILNEMRQISLQYGLKLYSCCNDSYVGENTFKGSCISGTLLNRIAGSKQVSEAKTPTRIDCGCTRSIDIGDYLKHPCYSGCIYCYANPVWK